ncbi:methylated-DNA--[protein]-cysteine S-methyltransferase [Arthrobacter agilis]|uniref:methylated-DNA--[protein]-cysteine S-methyltransferase n=1 Tax=Arthrobacter agilis TaxID=37921 RepID=UPI00278099E0|nr:methylated-DNA--[protein]-cysteine S-methyltransferase [Arthrobacter agilis]MDQ0735193.1 methylated-DNA-[protein]-cysteine S-methyltransferase [Arthrobacter agilis]
MNRTSTPAGEEERWQLDISTPIGGLHVVAGRAAIVGLYHADHHPMPPPVALGRRIPVTPGPAQEAVREAGVERPAGAAGAAGDTDPPAPDPVVVILQQAEAELGEYFAGLRRAFDVPVDLRGTVFQRSVWSALLGIPYGQRRSYRDIAGELGNPRMGRAIGAAVRANPVSVIIPGHRVVGSTGAVVGYAAGPATKKALLDLEAGLVTAPFHSG